MSAPGSSQTSIQTKVRVVIVALSLILVGIFATVLIEVNGIRFDLRRISEEHREAEIANSLLFEIRGIDQIADLSRSRERISDVGRRDQHEHLKAALLDLEQLWPPHQESADKDPSEEQHEAEETRMRALLRERLGELSSSLERESDSEEIRESLGDAKALAASMAEEMSLEAHEASADLEKRGSRLLRLVAILASAAAIVLLAIRAFVQRSIVRPIRALKQGASTIGSGALDQEIPVRSSDEIGDLAREINAMAVRMRAHRDELESRVLQRTRELIRTARLADIGSLAADLTHEINTPVSSIAACAEGLQRRLENGESDTDDQRELLEIIAREAYRVNDITRRLLEISRKEGEELGPTDVSQALESVALLVQHRFQQGGVELELQVEPELVPALSNGAELQQVLLNLLGNALDVSEANSVVRVAARRVGSDLCIEVYDQGPGIDPKAVDRIFDPFFTTKNPGQGTGLGLTIVQRILERQGGNIEVVESDEGACFRVRLPIALANRASPG